MGAKPFEYQPEVEAERVGAARETIGPAVALAPGAVRSFNLMPWSIKQLVRMLKMLEPCDLARAEEMLPPFDPAP